MTSISNSAAKFTGGARFGLAALLLVTASGAANAANPATMDLAGDWRYLPYEGPMDMCAPAIDDAGWAAMHLPSSWFLLGRKEYPAKARADQPLAKPGGPADLSPPDPAEGLDYSGTLYFRRHVEWRPGALPRALPYQLIDLDMVDYYADVEVNGVSIGHHEGYFQHFALNVTRALKPGSNLICVRVSAPAQIVDLEQQYPVSWPKQQSQIKGVFGYHDARPGGTSRRGQSRSTGGILRGIALRESAGVEIAALSVTPLDVSTAKARLVIDARIHNWTDKPVEVSFDGEIVPANFKGAIRVPVHMNIHAAPGDTHADTELLIEKPALWWTWDRGQPNLHVLKARLTSAGALLDERIEEFGVRSITRDAQFQVRLNGQRIYLRGSNYIATQWLSQADAAFYGRDIALMLAAHLNTVRVHAHVARPEFYRAADRAGLLVWQDFPLQWGYTDLPAFHEEALRQAGEMIEALGNHPSIFLWSMHNESPHAMDWMKKRVADQNRALDEKLVALAARLDPSRIAHRDSGSGDSHCYFGWYHDTAATLAKMPDWILPMVTEYGAQALPDRASLEQTIELRALWPMTEDHWEAWRYANFQKRETFEVAHVDKGHDLSEFIASSQAYQGALLRYQTELLRRQKWTRSSGLYQFMLTDPWPAITWSVVDYYRRPKAGYEALKSAMQPVLPSIEYAIDDPTRPLVIHVVNDNVVGYRGARLKYELRDAKGTRITGGERRVDIAPDGVQRIVELGAHPEIAAGGATLEVVIESGAGVILGKSVLGAREYWR